MVRKHLTRILALAMTVIMAGGLFSIDAEAATKKKKKSDTPNNIVSTKLDTNYIKTVKDGKKTWYKIDAEFLNMDQPAGAIYGTKSVGEYCVTLPDKSDTYMAVGIYDYATGVLKEFDSPFNTLKTVSHDFIVVEGSYRLVVYPDGTSGAMSVFGVFDMDGNRISNIDFQKVTIIDSEYFMGTFYRSSKPTLAIFDRSGNIVFEKKVKSTDVSAVLYGSYIKTSEKKYYVFPTGEELTEKEYNEKIKDIDPDSLNERYIKYPDIYKYSEKEAFLEKYGSKWDSVSYLGCNRFYVIQKPKGKDWICSIVDGNNKVLFTDKKGYQYSTSEIIDNKLYFITMGEVAEDGSLNSYNYKGFMDVNCKEIVAPDNYYTLTAIDGGFLGCKEWSGKKNGDLNYNCVINLEGKELISARMFSNERTEIYSYYEGQLTRGGAYLGYNDAGLPDNAIMFFCADYDFLKNNVSTNILTFPEDKNPNEFVELQHLKNAGKTYKAAAKKSTIPSLMAWHLYSFVTYGLTPIYNTETVYVRPTKTSEPLYNITSKGKRITSEPKLMLSSEVVQKENKLIVSWNKYLDCEDYIIEYGTKKAFDEGTQKSYEYVKFMQRKFTYTFSKDGEMIFKVKAVDKENNKDLTDWIETTVSYKYIDKNSQLPKITFTNSFEAKTNKLTFKYTNIKNAKKYIIEYGYEEDFENDTFKTSTKEAKSPYSFTYTVKKEGTMKFRIQAVDSKGEPVSQKAELTLKVAPTKLEVTSFKNAKSKQVTLSWTSVKGAASYQIMYKKAGTDGNGKSATNTQRITSTTFTFSVPTANTDYVFKFRALDKNSNILFGWTDWTEAYHVD